MRSCNRNSESNTKDDCKQAYLNKSYNITKTQKL